MLHMNTNVSNRNVPGQVGIVQIILLQVHQLKDVVVIMEISGAAKIKVVVIGTMIIIHVHRNQKYPLRVNKIVVIIMEISGAAKIKVVVIGTMIIIHVHQNQKYRLQLNKIVVIIMEISGAAKIKVVVIGTMIIIHVHQYQKKYQLQQVTCSNFTDSSTCDCYSLPSTWESSEYEIKNLSNNREVFNIFFHFVRLGGCTLYFVLFQE